MSDTAFKASFLLLLLLAIPISRCQGVSAKVRYGYPDFFCTEDQKAKQAGKAYVECTTVRDKKRPLKRVAELGGDEMKPLAQNYQIKGWGSVEYPAISVEITPLIKRKHHPYVRYIADWDWMRKSADIEDRRAWQAPVPFPPKIYLKERWWLEPQPDPQLAEAVEDRMPNPGFRRSEPTVIPVDCPGSPNCPQIPDEAMKKRALQRGYELNGNSMCCGSIDVSQDPIVTGRAVITPETEFNVLDATSVAPEKKKEKKK